MGLQRCGIVFETLGGLLVSIQYQAVIVEGVRVSCLRLLLRIGEGAPVVPPIFGESMAAE